MTPIDERTLVAYVDGELDPPAAAEVERALAEDPALREAADRLGRSTLLLRAALDERAYAPTPADARTLALLGMATSRRRWLVPAAALAGLALGAGLMAAAERLLREPQEARDPLTPILDQLVASHALFASERERLVEIPAERRYEFTRWAGGRIGRPLFIPDLSANGYRFAGGRLLAIEGHPTAWLLYVADNKPPLSLAVMPFAQPRPAAVAERPDWRVLRWARERYLYAIVAAEDEPALRAIWQAARPAIERGT